MSTHNLPLVSVITPTYNGASFLEALILSVKGQDYSRIEHIVIDDGSTDNGATVSILNKFPHLRWWTRPNKGQYATMNEGLLAAQGEIVGFICADDIMSPSAISTAVNYLSNHLEDSSVFGSFGHIDKEGEKLDLFQPMFKLPTSLYPYSLHISHASLYIWKKCLIQNDLFFSANLKFVGDYDWMVRIMRSNLKIGKIQKELSMIRIHDQQTSKTRFFAMRQEIYSVQKQLNISPFFASGFRKLWFLLNLINEAKVEGFKGSWKILRNRVGTHFEN